MYYYCYVSDTTNNTGTGINTVKSISATIGKKATTAPTLTAGYKTTYDGSVVYAKAASASGNPAGKIYYGSSSGATTYNIIASTTATNLTEMGQTNVGTTTIYAFFRPTDTTNYADSDVVNTTVKVTNKATPTMTLNGSGKTYDGSASYIAGTASVAGKIYFGTTSATSGMTSYEVVSANTSTNLTSITNAGTQPVTVGCDTVTGGRAKCTNYTLTNTSATLTSVGVGEATLTATTDNGKTATASVGVTAE